MSPLRSRVTEGPPNTLACILRGKMVYQGNYQYLLTVACLLLPCTTQRRCTSYHCCFLLQLLCPRVINSTKVWVNLGHEERKTPVPKLQYEVCSVYSLAYLCFLFMAQKSIIRHLMRIYYVSSHRVRRFRGKKKKKKKTNGIVFALENP